jgi:hypothetical protein
MVGTIEEKVHMTKRNDNFYGRLFETSLSEYVVNNPDEEMIQVRDIVSSTLLSDFARYTEQYKCNLCGRIAQEMRDDPPPWRHNLEAANVFLATEAPQDFVKMLGHDGPYSVPLVLSLAVKYVIQAHGMLDLMGKASEFYVAAIRPQRLLVCRDSADAAKSTNLPGLLLPYQRGGISNKLDATGTGVRPIDKYARPGDLDGMTEHDVVAATYERTIGIGMSGSANILHFLFNSIAAKREFPMDAAKFATASWLTYSGGHSFNEAYSTFAYMNSGNFTPLSFNDRAKIPGSIGTGILTAYDAVIEASSGLNPSRRRAVTGTV